MVTAVAARDVNPRKFVKYFGRFCMLNRALKMFSFASLALQPCAVLGFAGGTMTIY